MKIKKSIMDNMRNSFYKSIELQKISLMTQNSDSRGKIKEVQDKEYKKWKFYKKLSKVMSEQNDKDGN